MASKKFTSPFATDNTPAEEVHTLITTGLAVYDPEKDRLDWEKVDNGSIGYNRGWLIVARAWLEQNEPQSLVTLPDPSKYDSKGAYEQACGKVVSKLRNEMNLSWGRIMVITGQTEGFVRKVYEADGIQKSKGLRIGKGGRFAYGDPQLYLDNRKVEGAQIRKETVGKPRIEDLLNFKPREGDTNAATKGRAISTIVKLRAKANDAAVAGTPEADAFHAKADELMARYNITVADISQWEAHRASKGRKGKAA